MVMGYRKKYDGDSSAVTTVNAPSGSYPFDPAITEKMSMLSIPSEVDEKKVIAIGEHAFSKCEYDIIKLPKTVRLILNGAFENSRIKFVHMLGVRFIGDMAFGNCRELKMVEFPECHMVIC